MTCVQKFNMKLEWGHIVQLQVILAKMLILNVFLKDL